MEKNDLEENRRNRARTGKSGGKVILSKTTAIIKVVGNYCNLRCKYCFHNAKDQSTCYIMSDRLLEKFIKEYLNVFHKGAYFIWHGGEPLLAGLSFFEKVVKLQKRYQWKRQIVKNSIQTNATLINDEWADFFKIHDFGVGVSLDGNKTSHNRFRVDTRGKGTFDRVIKGIMILRAHGIRPGIIQVLTHDNLSNVKGNFRFFVDELGVKGWGINPYLDLSDRNMNMHGQSVTNRDLIKYFRAVIKLWLSKNDPSLRIREIDNFLSGILGKRTSECSFNGSCGSGFFCLEYNGDVYPCDALPSSKSFCLGNLSRQSLGEILNSPARMKFIEKVRFIPDECLKCKWQPACHSGCTNQRSVTFGRTYYCETRKIIFDYLSNIMKNWKKYNKKGGVKHESIKKGTC